MNLWTSLAWTLALGLSVSGCGSKEAVSLAVTVENPEVGVTTGAFATLMGRFDLRLQLGPEAPGSTMVTLGSFALENQPGIKLVDPLPADPDSDTFPVTVAKGSTKIVPFTLHVTKALSAAERDALCAGQVRIVGAVMDSLGARTDPALSDFVTPTCG
jgi:hypothetical protein